MGSWTKARLLATKDVCYTDIFDYYGPACYQLIIMGPRGGNLRYMYVGETNNEMLRISCYGRYGSHLAHLIDEALAEGNQLFYTAHAFPTKELAKRRQDSLLAKWDYPWNRILNGSRW